MRLKIAGFTLLELMIGIAVLAILVTVAAPAMQNTIRNNRLTAQANDLVTAFQFARSEAIRKNGSIDICASTDGTTCAGSGTSWSDGWIVVDPDGDTNNGNPEPSRVWRSLGGQTTLTAPTASFEYDSSGRIDPSAQMELTVPNCRARQRRVIEVGSSGRVSVRPEDCL